MFEGHSLQELKGDDAPCAQENESVLDWDQKSLKKWLELKMTNEQTAEEFLEVGEAKDIRQGIASIGGKIKGRLEGTARDVQRDFRGLWF